MTLRQTFRFIVLSTTAVSLSACITAQKQKVNVKKIYEQSAQYHLPDRNPIIVIPGILGSSLVDDESGKTVWGAFRAEYADPKTAEGARLVALPLEGQDHVGNVQPDGVLESLKLNLAGVPVSVQLYAGILTTLGAGGYRDESLGLNAIDYGTDHFTCFQFDYDWRKDIAYNAAKFKEFVDEKRADVQYQYKKQYGIENAEVKFDIAAHSMGGLLMRYYLRYGGNPLPEDGAAPALTWAGAKDIERAILVAPPNAGSLEALEQLVEGFSAGGPLLPHYPPEILGTFPSIYQLLPRPRHKAIVWDEDETRPVEDIYDPALWQKYGWGLSGTDEKSAKVISQILPNVSDEDSRETLASSFQAKALRKAKQFQDAIDRPATPPEGLDLFLVAGDATDTPEIMSIDSETGEIEVLRTGVGDKTVLRSSALLDERMGGEWKPTVQSPISWTSVLFVPSEHRKITSDPVFEDNVLYWLLEDPRIDR